MKTLLVLLTFLTAACFASLAQNGARYVTLVNTNGNAVVTFQLLQGETAEVVSRAPNEGLTTSVLCYKNDATIVCYGGPTIREGLYVGSGVGTTVAGPATFKLFCSQTPVFVTLRVTPETYEADKTLILPSTTNQVSVTMESSTNLIHWAAATNGVYGSPMEARFFRVKMQSPPSL